MARGMLVLSTILSNVSIQMQKKLNQFAALQQEREKGAISS